MKTNKQCKYVHKPFDVELAKKIQSGEIEGRIVSDTGHLVRIIYFDARNENPIVALIILSKSNTELLRDFNLQGVNFRYNDHLYLELPEEEPKHEFQPFEQVLVCKEWVWVPRLYGYSEHKHLSDRDETFHIMTDGKVYLKCIPFKGNEHLIGTTINPK